MIKDIRWHKILELLKEDHIILVNDIIEKLNLSPTTVRRDLTEMEQQGLIKRTHGGVKLKESKEYGFEEQINQKIQHNAKEKYLIADKAVKLIKDKMSIYLDAGSSTLALIKLIDPTQKIIIITNSILHAELLAIAGFHDVYLLGVSISYQLVL
ncbi:C-terminal truncated transcriptional regulator [Spiroplasma eriocheiris CCTCC M 207170]|nr:C-terminal truncated transcriptional regulator [Spiroplasma eriocheiris CCTCC M 207170]